MEPNTNTDDDWPHLGTEDELVIRTVYTEFDVSDIQKIKLFDGSLINCHCAIRIDNDEITHSAILNRLLSGALQSRGQSLIRHRLFNLNDEDLKELGRKYKITFKRCTVEIDPSSQNYVFNVIDSCQTLPIVYVVKHEREPIALCISSNSYLHNLHQELAVRSNDAALLHFELASYYQKNAEDNAYSLASWQIAYYYYSRALRCSNNIALRYPLTFGYCKCLMQLSKYKRAKEKLEKLTHIYGSAQLWLLLARAQRKIGDSDEATKTIKKCYEFDRNYKEAIIEQKLIEQNANRKQRLIDAKVSQQRILDERRIGDEQRKLDKRRIVDEKRKLDQQRALVGRPKLITTDQADDLRRTRDRDWYHILSIDGGGFRGLMPAIWLTAIERGTKRHCSSMFQMLAGTST